MTSVHSRQFLLGTRSTIASLAPPGWASADLGGGFALLHDSRLNVTRIIDASGATWWLLGTAADTAAPVTMSPGGRLAGTSTSEVPAAVAEWAGRWLLVGNDIIIPDAGGLLGCYYLIEPGARGPIVSSSLALLAPIAAREPRERTSEPWHHVTWFDYRVPPTSGLAGICKLMAGQLLDWRSGTVLPGVLPSPAEMSNDIDETVERFGDRLITSVLRLTRSARTRWLALTAGSDSRLMLAALLRAGVPTRAVTLEHPYMTYADRTLPPRIAEAAGVRHTFVRPASRPRAELLSTWDTHTAGASQDVDRLLYARGQFRFLEDGDVLLRSGCFEVSSESHIYEFQDMVAHSAPPAAHHILAPLGARATPSMVTEVERWRSWVLRSSDAGLDWRIRLYIEARLSGWLSSIEQGLDLLNGISLHPANCTALHAVGLSLPEPYRVARRHQLRLIESWSPQLAAFPYNPPDPLWRRVRRRGRLAVRQIRRRSQV